MFDEADLTKSIRTIPDYPKPGILFRDITTLLGDARAFRRAIELSPEGRHFAFVSHHRESAATAKRPVAM